MDINKGYILLRIALIDDNKLMLEFMKDKNRKETRGEDTDPLFHAVEYNLAEEKTSKVVGYGRCK